MKEVKFESQEDLYQRLLPALKSKKKLLSIEGFKSVKKSDIWDYLRYNKWSNQTGLELCDMVDDILNADNSALADFAHNRVLKRDGMGLDLPKLK